MLFYGCFVIWVICNILKLFFMSIYRNMVYIIIVDLIYFKKIVCLIFFFYLWFDIYVVFVIIGINVECFNI